MGATKVCRHCGSSKAEGEFYRDKSQADGLAAWCKECTREYERQRRAKSSGKVVQKAKGLRVMAT